MLNYIGFYNYSVEDFKTSESQVWVGVKIHRPRYLDPNPVFLTDCRLVTKTIWKRQISKDQSNLALTLLNYFDFTIAQWRILRLQKHKSGWGSRYPGHGILTPTLYSWQIVRLVTKTVWKRQISKELRYLHRPQYLDPNPVFLTDCAISCQDHMKKANI